MMKYIIAVALFVGMSFLDSSTANAQIVDGAFARQDIAARKPLPLPYVREADILWSKRIWRIVDMREKMNQYLFFPTTEMEGYNNLINNLLKGIQEEKITAYDARLDDEFKVPMTYEQVKEAFGAVSRVNRVRDPETGEYREVTVAGQIRPEEIKQLMIKEEWFFDKHSSSMNVRIIGLCPIQEYFRDEDINQENVQRRQVFWVYYPEVRDLLSSCAVKNEFGSSTMSFDDLFIKRRFSSYIVKASNTYDNRAISQYLEGQDAMLESKRIENEIFDYEQDLWEY